MGGIKYFLCFMLISCNPIAGTLPEGGSNIEFNCSKRVLMAKMDNFFELYPKYTLPKEYEKLNTWKARGYDFLYYRIFYFNKKPKEIYFVTFVVPEGGSLDDYENLDDEFCAISVREFYSFKDKSWMAVDLKENERTLERFSLLLKFIKNIKVTDNYIKDKDYKEIERDTIFD